MAERPKGYGMTAELQAKKAGKYDQQLANDAGLWINSVLKKECVGVTSSPEELHEKLKDGIILCEVINTIQPGSVQRINESKMAFKMMENIGNFLSACDGYAVPKADMFQTVDLFEAQNMPQVLNGIHALARKAAAKGFTTAYEIGPKEATANKREFTEEQLKEGQNVIGLQMGSNQGASQAGSTPYGLGRQIDKTNLKV